MIASQREMKKQVTDFWKILQCGFCGRAGKADFFMQTRGRKETGSPVVPFFCAEVHLLRAIFYFGLMDWLYDALGLDTWAAASPTCPPALLWSRFTFRLGCQLELNAFLKPAVWQRSLSSQHFPHILKISICSGKMRSMAYFWEKNPVWLGGWCSNWLWSWGYWDWSLPRDAVPSLGGLPSHSESSPCLCGGEGSFGTCHLITITQLSLHLPPTSPWEPYVFLGLRILKLARWFCGWRCLLLSLMIWV